jgi:isopropylmalate/homocitrate/citramalate synthase
MGPQVRKRMPNIPKKVLIMTTLREGEEMPGARMTVHDKVEIAVDMGVQEMNSVKRALEQQREFED